MSKRIATLFAGVAVVFVLGLGTATSAPGVGELPDEPTAIERTPSGIAYKTFLVPVDDLHAAAVGSLGAMEMQVTRDAAAPGGRRIAATAGDRRIEIALEQVEPGATRMQVVAEPAIGLFRDGETAAEIIFQTAAALGERRRATVR